MFKALLGAALTVFHFGARAVGRRRASRDHLLHALSRRLAEASSMPCRLSQLSGAGSLTGMVSSRGRRSAEFAGKTSNMNGQQKMGGRWFVVRADSSLVRRLCGRFERSNGVVSWEEGRRGEYERLTDLSSPVGGAQRLRRVVCLTEQARCVSGVCVGSPTKDEKWHP